MLRRVSCLELDASTMYFNSSCLKLLRIYTHKSCNINVFFRCISFTTSRWRRGDKKEKLSDNNIKWKFLEHKGPLFPPPYEPLPVNLKFYYEDKEIRLSKDAEEMATFYAKLIEHEYTSKNVFNRNFLKNWRDLMTKEERLLIKDLKKCNFATIHQYFVAQCEKKKALSKEEKQKIKEQNDETVEQYGYCRIDSYVEKIGNYKIEPPGLFRGRGEHPKMGMLKKRIEPEDVTINCSVDSKIPVPPEKHQWKEVIHDNTVTWLACWKENISDKVKYVWLNQASKLHCKKDHQKYELARRLAKHVKKIREDYLTDLKSDDVKVKQRAVALYFIDKLALRAGNEKDNDEADTVGCCSLRVEHVQLFDEKDGKKYVVVFDFPGKDSIQYYNEVPVDELVFNNLRLFCDGKKRTDELFDKLNTNSLNKYLNELMDGLTTKVFRTYNASITLQNQLDKLTDEQATLSEKLLQYNRANRAVAILCNHQRVVPKTHEQSMDNLNIKIDCIKKQIADAQKQLKKANNEIESDSKSSERVLERKEKKLKKLKDKLMKLKMKQTDKEENKTVALRTSKLNYLDPRISVSWCKKHNVPMERIYSKTQQSKFQWAIDSATQNFKF